MKEYSYWVVDAFSAHPYRGNPAAVVFDADDLADEWMQRIARYLNLSETVFLCSPRSADGADYLARIFTPAREIPFAGHPTIAAAFAHYSNTASGGETAARRLGQECGVGTVAVEVESRNGRLFFNLTAGAASAREAEVSRPLVARMLGCGEGDLCDLPVEVCSGGLPWMVVKLRSLDVSKRLSPDHALIDRICASHAATGVTSYCDGAELPGADHHLRTFAPGVGILEDPACGSGSIAVAIHKARHALADGGTVSFVCEQGLEMGREALLHLDVRRDGPDRLSIRLGGHAARAMQGRLLA